MNWRNAEVLGFDVETTGLDPEREEVVQLTIVKYREGKAWSGLDGFTQIFGTTRPLPAGQALFCGLMPEELEGKPTLVQCMPTVQAILDQGKVFLAYNAGFDVRFLRQAAKQAGCKVPMTRQNTIDPLVFCRALYPNVRGRNLNQMAMRLGVKLAHAHDATYDTLAALEVMTRLAVQHGLPSELNALILLQEQFTNDWAKQTGHDTAW